MRAGAARVAPRVIGCAAGPVFRSALVLTAAEGCAPIPACPWLVSVLIFLKPRRKGFSFLL